MEEALLLLAGAVVGLVSSLGAEEFRRRRRKRDDIDEMYRRAVADFVSKATGSRYELEQLASNRIHGRYSVNESGVPATLTKADLEFGFSYHFLTLVVDPETARLARDLRRHLERMKGWVVGPFDALSDEELDERVEEAWRLRDACVDHARGLLGLGALADDDKPSQPATSPDTVNSEKPRGSAAARGRSQS